MIAATPPATFSIRDHPGATVVRASGEIDLWTAPTLQRHLTKAIEARPHMVVVDLSRVEFMDSACAHALLTAAAAARAAAVSLIVHRPPSPVDQVLDLCIVAAPPAPLVP